ncbi:MAG: GNAT family N-acetyltransferase [Prolixibacteraceae bacterium]|nr:GNAT family N-acetyltransferase [Prolixibacteraceae bacterium]
MKYIFKRFDELSNYELYEILKLRSEIFVVEQHCVYNDLDDFDKYAIHQFVKKNDKIIAYARLLKPGTRFCDFSIGRLVVDKAERGNGFGTAIMNEAKKYMIENLKADRIKISAQQYLQQFYEKLGFVAVTEMYLEDGIPHLAMVYKINQLSD